MYQYQHVIVNAYTPQETTELASRAGVAKANMRLDKMFISSVVAGMLLAFACAVSLSTNSSPWYQDNAPGLIRMIAAVIFPFGLTMIVVTGTDLCTGSFMFTPIAVLHRRLSIWKMLLHWFVTFWGNLAGSLFVMALVTGYGGVFSSGAYRTEALSFANTKVVTPEWHMIFLRGIGANWLVCMACFLAIMAREFFSKVMAVWWPTFAFVALGLDHVVANMFFVPIAIFEGSPTISVSYYIWKSMIPALIGNIVGGAVFVGFVFWYLYLEGSSTPVPIDGSLFANDVEAPLIGEDGATPDNVHTAANSEDGKKSAEHMV